MKDLFLTKLHAVQGGSIEISTSELTEASTDQELELLASKLITEYPEATQEEIFNELKIQREHLVIAL